jgi:hypothetical protein
MSPRTNRWLLGVAILVLFLLGVCPLQGAAAARPSEMVGPQGPAPSKILDPPQNGGGVGERDGGDPDEVVIFIVSPGNPVVVPSGSDQSQAKAGAATIPSVFTDFRVLLFWAGLTR